jgi:hypothetical protein
MIIPCVEVYGTAHGPRTINGCGGLVSDRVDPTSSVLILQWQPVLRTKELVRPATDCLQHIEAEHWVIRVPRAKSHCERRVVKNSIREVLARLAFPAFARAGRCRRAVSASAATRSRASRGELRALESGA